MEGNFPNSTYNRKSSVVVKETSTMDFYRDCPVLIIDSIRKKSNSTYNGTSTFNRKLRVNDPKIPVLIAWKTLKPLIALAAST